MVGTADRTAPNFHAPGVKIRGTLVAAVRQLRALTARRTGPPLALRVPSNDAARGGTLVRPAPCGVCTALRLIFSVTAPRAFARLIFAPGAVKPQSPASPKQGHGPFHLYSSLCGNALSPVGIAAGSARADAGLKLAAEERLDNPHSSCRKLLDFPSGMR